MPEREETNHMFLGSEAVAGLRGASIRLRLALAKCHADLTLAEDAVCGGEDLVFDEAEAILLGLRQHMSRATVNLQAGRRVLEQATRHAAAVDNALEEFAAQSSSDGEVLA